MDRGPLDGLNPRGKTAGAIAAAHVEDLGAEPNRSPIGVRTGQPGLGDDAVFGDVIDEWVNPPALGVPSDDRFRPWPRDDGKVRKRKR